MSTNATRAGKRKRVDIEGGLDSDSGEERDVDIEVVVDGHGHGQVSRMLHISQTSRKRPQSWSAPLPNVLSSASPSADQTSEASEEKTIRKQVCGFSVFACAQNAHVSFIIIISGSVCDDGSFRKTF
jgi:hypothetical protein